MCCKVSLCTALFHYIKYWVFGTHYYAIVNLLPILPVTRCKKHHYAYNSRKAEWSDGGGSRAAEHSQARPEHPLAVCRSHWVQVVQDGGVSHQTYVKRSKQLATHWNSISFIFEVVLVRSFGQVIQTNEHQVSRIPRGNAWIRQEGRWTIVLITLM